MALRCGCPARLLGLVLVLACLLHCATAFPYGRSSAVTELTPATFPNFVNTHKPVVILFYAPWCGHCKQFHPEFERFAASMKGTMRVGAIDADQHSSIGQQYGIRGFPTIKYWKMGTKSIASPQDYQGQRTAAALQSYLVSDITPAQVKAVATTEQLKQVARDAPHWKTGVLFSVKNKVPPMLSVMALSPKLKSFPLTFVGDCVPSKGVALNFNVTELPTLGVLHYTPADGAGDEKFEMVPYPKRVIAYEPVAHFFADCVDQGCLNNDGPEVGGAAAAAAATPLDEEEGVGRAGRRRRPHVALPVQPVAFTGDTLANFCSPHSLKTHGRSPLCVISLTGRVNLDHLHQLFQNDPLLFFDATQHRAEVVQQFADDFGISLSADASVDSGAVVLLRQGRHAQVRHTLLTDMQSDNDLQVVLQRVLNGELRLEKTHVERGRERHGEE